MKLDGRAGALALADALANDPVVHQCYARHLIEYAYGRPHAEQDDGVAQRLTEDQTISLRDLIVALATSRAFLNRSTEELP